MEKHEGTEDFDINQRNIELPEKWHTTRKRKEKIMMSIPECVRLREEAATRCTAKIKRKVLKKQARKARTEHQLKCCLQPGKKAQRKPLTELRVKGHFTEDRDEWRKELQKHCEEVYTDQEEAEEAQQSRTKCVKEEVRSAIYRRRT